MMKSLIPEWAEVRLKEPSNPIFTPEQIAEIRSMTVPREATKVMPEIVHGREVLTIKKKPGRPRKI